MKIRALFLCIITCLCITFVHAAKLKTITINQEFDKTSLFFTIDGFYTHKLFTLNNPNRVVVDLKGISSTINMNQLHIANGLITKVRSSKPDPSSIRLVLDLGQNVQVHSAPWKANSGYNGLRVDLMHGGKLITHAHTDLKTKKPTAVFVKNPQVMPKPKTRVFEAKKPELFKEPMQAKSILAHKPLKEVTHRPPQSLRNVIVVLDAGHGGKDPGARGPRHSKEKDVVLAITLKLKQLIDRQPGMKAVLTRSGDYYVGLRQRLDMARKYNGDVFVSIHADAFNNPHSNGASVFALSQRGATSEAARWIAEKENYSELGGVNLGDLDDTNGVVRSVLIDLSQTATINSGLQMGGRVLRQLDNFTRLHNNKVEQARFVVLKSPDIPSILVETGFISNPREESNLTNSSYQTRLSQAIFQGIKGYFWENPPHGSRIEAMASSHFHLVKSGDTLPKIASRYHVTVSSLQALNGLRGNRTPRPGQKLVIPSAWA